MLSRIKGHYALLYEGVIEKKLAGEVGVEPTFACEPPKVILFWRAENEGWSVSDRLIVCCLIQLGYSPLSKNGISAFFQHYSNVEETKRTFLAKGVGVEPTLIACRISMMVHCGTE